MGRKVILVIGAIFVSIVFITANATTAAAQGKSRGAGGGGASPGGPPSGTGVDRGIGTSSDSSMGRADTGRSNASDRSNGRSDAGLDRARVASENLRSADSDLRLHPSLASDLHVNANDLRAGYQTALTANPNLTFGQYVAATRLAQNLGRNNPNITRDAILAGLADGHSIGRTLQDLGLSKDEAKTANKQVDLEIKQSRRRG
jgi:hypothetical protein